MVLGVIVMSAFVFMRNLRQLEIAGDFGFIVVLIMVIVIMVWTLPTRSGKVLQMNTGILLCCLVKARSQLTAHELAALHAARCSIYRKGVDLLLMHPGAFHPAGLACHWQWLCLRRLQ